MTKEESRRDKLLLATIKRSDDWPKVRRRFLKMNPTCAVCGARKKITAHHILPYHLFPELELDPTNLITLCEGGANHHLNYGHLMSWKSYNANVVTDASIWHDRIKFRPKWKQVV
jgi:5-methylcytosine-specific restriction endonuclease McrA